jgi:hypothetical protein
MIDEQPSKRSRTLMDLSPDDRQAFERVARILNKPLSQLYEDNPQRTNVRQDGTVLDPGQGEDAMYAGQQTWFPTTQWQENGWQPDFGGDVVQNPHTNGLSAPSSGSMFEEENGNSLFQWPEHTSQGSVAQIGGGGTTAPDDSSNWFPVPTEVLLRINHEDRMIGDSGTSSSSTGVTQAINTSPVLSRDDQLTSNATYPRQDQDATDGSSTPSRTLFDSEVVEPDWVDVKASQDSGFESQPISSEDAATSEWSLIESTKARNSFLFDNPNPKSVKWVSSDSTGKELSPRKKRGPFQDQHLREETSDTRKLKACVRCRMQKIRVSVFLMERIELPAYENSAIPTPIIQAEFARHVRMFRSRKSTHFRACGTSLLSVLCIEPEKLQEWNLPSDGQ